MRDVLIINSYAGSLTVAATQLGLKIRGSYEDSGYGIKTQKFNFPNLKYVDALPWPEDDLTETVVIAHPPCAAFSKQNINASARGVKADSFGCHKMVMTYSLQRGAQALAIESVPGFLDAARGIHESYARRYKYNLFRIRQNAVTFGVPQWRERAWIIFMRRPFISLFQPPIVRTLDKIWRAKGTPPPPNTEMKRFFERMEEIGWTRERVTKEFLSEKPGAFLPLAKEMLGYDEVGPNYEKVRKKLNLGGRFASKMPRVLNLEGVATVLLRDSNFYFMGRELFVEEYLELMGFPPTYRFPPSELPYFKERLSKGVCPPVAKWILRQTINNLNGGTSEPAAGDWVKVLSPGETADFTVKRNFLKQRDFLMEKFA